MGVSISLSPPPNPIQNVKPNRDAVHIESTLICQIMAAAAKAEMALGVAFINAQKAIPMWQPPTPLKTDNSTAHGILRSLLCHNRSKAFNMRFYWLKEDQIKQKQFQDIGNQGYPPTHHWAMISHYLHYLTMLIKTAKLEICTMDLITHREVGKSRTHKLSKVTLFVQQLPFSIVNLYR